MLTSGEINVIGNILNTTWGKRSTEAGSFPRGTAPAWSIKGQLVTSTESNSMFSQSAITKDRMYSVGANQCRLVITFTDFVTFRSHQEIQAEVKVFRQKAEKVCANALTELKQNFRGAANRNLKVKFIQDYDDVETIYSPSPEISLIAAPRVRPAIFRGYYRYTGVYAVE
jgi:hypothetical protein